MQTKETGSTFQRSIGLTSSREEAYEWLHGIAVNAADVQLHMHVSEVSVRLPYAVRLPEKGEHSNSGIT